MVTFNVSGRGKRSAFVKTLIVLNIFTGIIVIISIAIIIRFAAIIRENGPTSVCKTSGCVHAAAEILEFMDKTIDPCHDFYDFSCGNFVNNTLLDDDRTSIDAFSLVRDRTQEKIYKLINANVTGTDIRAFALAKNLYQACMNRTQIEKLGLQPLIDIHKTLGGWPCVDGDQWDRSFLWNWIDANIKFRKLGLSHFYLFGLDMGADMKNSTIRRLMIDQTSLGISRKLLIQGLNETVVKAYYNFMVNTALLFGGEKTRVEKEMMDALNFEIALANISLPMEERRNSTEMYNPMSLKDLQAKYPYNNWMHYINQILPTNLTVYENETIIVLSPPFFNKLGDLLAKTPHRTIANYLIWRITDSMSDYLNDEIRKLELKFTTAATGKKEYPSRWKECMSMISQKMPIAVGSLYIRNHFKPKAKVTASQMVDGIRREFRASLKRNTWMDEKTKESALNKLEAINYYIGYPDEFYDDEKINDYYNRAEIDPQKYFQSVLDLNLFLMDDDYEELRNPINKTDWTEHASATAVNAFYSFEENSIELPAAILQSRFFSDNHPRYLNYGAIGFIIGHELTHGFDDEGRQYDLEGNLVDWWQNSTKHHFLQRAKCIIEQYGNFTDPSTNMSINGINTQGENIADNGGLKQAYNAYLKWIKENGNEQRLPGLVEYSPQQLFWIASAQTWCSIERSEYTKLRILSGVHALDKYRVIGTLSNLLEFSKDFNCPRSSRMNPNRKCQVW